MSVPLATYFRLFQSLKSWQHLTGIMSDIHAMRMTSNAAYVCLSSIPGGYRAFIGTETYHQFDEPKP